MSTDRIVANTYTITLETNITNGIKNFNLIDSCIVTIIDPCLTSTWNNNIQFANISTQVNYPPFIQYFTAFSLNTLISCGTVIYSLIPSNYSFI